MGASRAAAGATRGLTNNLTSYNAGQHMRDAVLALTEHEDGQRFFDCVSNTARALEPGTASLAVRAPGLHTAVAEN